jgi:redox-sensitive bicupin YhaK (pirin superfamily)
VIDGTVKVGDAALNKGDALGIWETDAVQIHAETESEFLIIETPVNQK